jgi:hypothetical protein
MNRNDSLLSISRLKKLMTVEPVSTTEKSSLICLTRLRVFGPFVLSFSSSSSK